MIPKVSIKGTYLVDLWVGPHKVGPSQQFCGKELKKVGKSNKK